MLPYYVVSPPKQMFIQFSVMSYVMACIRLPLEVFPDGTYKPMNDLANIIFEKCDILPVSSNMSSINLADIFRKAIVPDEAPEHQEEIPEPREELSETREEIPELETREETPEPETREEERVFVDPHRKHKHSRTMTFRANKPFINRTRRNYIGIEC